MNLNSNQPNFDWHDIGLWIAVDADGRMQPDFVASTAWACRATAQNVMGRPKCVNWTYQRLVPAVEPTLNLRDQVTSDESRWRYPANGEPAPSGDALLLTIGRTTVVGTWTNDGRYIAWAPKIQRDKELEERLGL